MSAYEQELEWLYSLEISKGIDLKLERVLAALECLGRPHQRLRCFHVAGTNGKGSVVAFLSAILGEAGYRVGAFTSPHLIDLSERLRVGGAEIARDDLADLSAEIRRRVVDEGIDLTFFEVLTAMAFLWFERSNVDYVALEVGLGGRFDATNVVDPLVSVITSIAVDHIHYLGDSELAIAGEKAGVIKRERPVVIAPMGEEVRDVIVERARACRAPFFRAGFEYEYGADDRGRMSFRGMGIDLEGAEIAMAGAHQVTNAASAVAAVAVAAEVVVGDEALRRGLASARWPGRLETVAAEPRTILDGAHNVAAMRALVGEIERLRGAARLCVLFAAMRDKEWQQMVDVLAPHCDVVVATEVIPERAVRCDRLARTFERHCSSVFHDGDPRRAFARLRASAGEGDLVLVTGSLFLVGAVRALLIEAGELEAGA